MGELQAIAQSYAEARTRGEALLLSTVVRVAGSAYRRPGARMLMSEDGWLAGAVSGGCLERHLLQRAAWHTARSRFARLTFDSTEDDGAGGFGLGCNGIVDILVERLAASDPLHPIEFIGGCLARRERGVLATVIGTTGDAPAVLGQRLAVTPSRAPASDLPSGALRERLEADAQQILQSGRSIGRIYPGGAGRVEVFLECIPAPVRLVVFGGGYDVVPLAQLASILGWQTTVVADRPWEPVRTGLASAELVISALDESVLERVAIDSKTLLVLMTHNYLQDRALLRALLPRPLRYLGVLGPRRRMNRLLEELGPLALGPGGDGLHSPIGLDLGAEQPEQIALAIVAEAQAVLSGRTGASLASGTGPIHPPSVGAGPVLGETSLERGSCPSAWGTQT